MSGALLNPKLKDIFENRGFKIYRDEAGKGLKEESWRYYELRGKRGMVYPYSATELAGWGFRKDGMCPTQFVKTRGYKVMQDADDALVFLFPASEFCVVSAKFDLKKKQVRIITK